MNTQAKTPIDNTEKLEVIIAQLNDQLDIMRSWNNDTKTEIVPTVTLTAHSTYSWMCQRCDENSVYTEPQEEDRYPHANTVTCCECLEKYNVTAVEHSDEEVCSAEHLKHKEEIEALKNELEFMTNVCDVRQQTIESLMARLTDARNKLAERVLQQSDLRNKLNDEISFNEDWLDIYETGFNDAMKQVLRWVDNQEVTE